MTKKLFLSKLLIFSILLPSLFWGIAPVLKNKIDLNLIELISDFAEEESEEDIEVHEKLDLFFNNHNLLYQIEFASLFDSFPIIHQLKPQSTHPPELKPPLNPVKLISIS